MTRNTYRSPEKLKAEADYRARRRSNAMIDRLHVKCIEFACCVCGNRRCSHILYGKIGMPFGERLVFCPVCDPGTERALAMMASIG